MVIISGLTQRYEELIKQLESTLTKFENKLYTLKQSDQFKNPNDVRLSYYYYSIQHIDACIHLLMYNTSLSLDKNKLSSFYEKYKIRDRNDYFEKSVIAFIQNRQNILQYITNQYSFSIFSTFEYAIRCILREKFEDDYYKMSGDIVGLLIYVMKKSDIYGIFVKEHKEKFIHLNLIRNAVHNNGVYLPDKKEQRNKNKVFEFIKGSPVYFNYGEPIKGAEAWEIHLLMTEELFFLFNEILKISEISDFDYIRDPGIQENDY
jgi:hypothetical protein